MAKTDWAKSSVGPREKWSVSLQTVLRLMLGSRYAMWLGWGPDLAFFYNDAYQEQTLGAKHPWALGRSTREVWAEIWGDVGPRVDHVLATGEATWDEGLLLFLERNGYPEETYHTFSYSPAPGDKGEIAGLFCVVIEETERVINERRIELLRRFAALLSTSKTRADVFEALEQVLTGDPREFSFSLTYAFSDDGTEARLVSRTHLPADHYGAEAVVNVDASTRGPWPFQLNEPIALVGLSSDHTWPTGGAWKIPPTHAFVLPIAHRGLGRPAGVFVAALNPHRPIDEGTRSFASLFVGQLAAGLANADAYEEEKRRVEALAALDRAKTAFFSNVSHEFRTPLTLMLGPTEDALGSPERSLSGEALEVVHRNELRLLKLVNTLLDFARMESGRVQATYEPTDLQALTTDLTSTFRSAMERGGLKYEVDCKPLSEPAFVDHDMWEKIVLNLLSNALKFTLEGSVSVSLRETSGDNDDPRRAELIVRDTGIGVSSAELPRLFERFHRIEGARARTHEGSGIGLALVRDLVELHGGTIEVTSEVGKGTAFRVLIPLGRKHLPAERVSESAHLPERPASRLTAYVAEALRWVPHTANTSSAAAAGPASKTDDDRAKKACILVADDNADMRDYLVRLLRPHWRVEAAADGAEAIELAARDRPDLVLSDVMMPKVDGFGLIRALREDADTASIPIMLLSARAGEEAVAEGLRAGADDYLVKPFAASTLVVRVEALLAAARSRELLRHAAEAERERLRSMFEESPAAIGVVRGKELTIEIVNRRILEIWGKSPDIIGMSLMDAIPEIRGQGFDDLLHKVLESGIAYQGKGVRARLDSLRTGDLVDVYMDFVYAPLRDADGIVRSVLIHAFDVTELVMARRVAENANRMKDEFLATMSHELRTPLNAILGWAALLRNGKQPQDPATIEKALATIERNARSQARIVEDILDVSRIVSGKLRLEIQGVDITSVLNAALDVVRPAAAGKAISLEVSLDPHLGNINGDADRLQQVFWNLLINAIRFTPSTGRISIEAVRAESQVVIRVRDSGVGIATEHLAHVFERFRQVDSSTTRSHGGLGLGLAIVRHLVELHGGTVDVASEGTGKGSTFTVRLPIRAVLLTSEKDGRSTPTPENAQPLIGDLGGVHVLVADDDEDSLDLVLNALSVAGAKVTTANSASSAFAQLQSASPRPNVLISDIGMPEEDGYSLIRRVRLLPERSGGTIPAIALTAYARKEDEAAAIAAGYQQHIAKPIDPASLVMSIIRLVRPRA